MIKEHKEALVERIKSSILEKKTDAVEKVVKATDSLTEQLSKLQALVREYKKAKKDKLALPASIKKISKEIKMLKKSLKKDWKAWRRFSKSIMRLKIVRSHAA